MKPSRIIYLPLQFAQLLLGLNAVIWLLFAIIFLLRQTGDGSAQQTVFFIIAVLMFANSGAMLVTAWLLAMRRQIFFFFAIALLLVNVILTFTDQFGVFDLLTLLIDLLLLGILLARRTHFLPAGRRPSTPAEEILRTIPWR
jgi:hypothetical protein